MVYVVSVLSSLSVSREFCGVSKVVFNVGHASYDDFFRSDADVIGRGELIEARVCRLKKKDKGTGHDDRYGP